MTKRNLMIMQGGGPTAVINASLAAVLQQAQDSVEIGHIYGARFGMQGLVRGETIELTDVPAEDLQVLYKNSWRGLGLIAPQSQRRRDD